MIGVLAIIIWIIAFVAFLYVAEKHSQFKDISFKGFYRWLFYDG